MNNFKAFQLLPFINEGLEAISFTKPTPIQHKVIPPALKGKDIIGLAQTGTGKTHAFLIPIMQKIDTSRTAVQAVITAPTRELATQIFEDAKKLAAFNPNISIALISGGMDRQKTIDKLKVQPHIVVGTPGRIKDLFIDAHVLNASTASILVVDEVDMTFDLGFLFDVDQIAGRMEDKLQMMVFSATIPQSIEPFLKKYLKTPLIVDVTIDNMSILNIEHILVPSKEKPKITVLKRILKGFDPYVCLIFVNTRKDAADIAHALTEEGLRVGQMHGDLEPRERKQMMKRIKNMSYQYIVATDIAARGLDIDGVSHIINVDLPMNDLSFYTHRAGRTGRGKYTGYCYSIYSEKEKAGVDFLRKQGIVFGHKDFKESGWIDLKPYNQRSERINHKKEVSPEISKITGKKVKVKPGYKRKRKAEITKIVRKEKRDMIRADIKMQKKNRAKIAQLEKTMAQE